jgi:hypothetical protein
MTSPWWKHVRAYQQEYPGMTLMECARDPDCQASYEKPTVVFKPGQHKWIDHVRQWISEQPEPVKWRDALKLARESYWAAKKSVNDPEPTPTVKAEPSPEPELSPLVARYAQACAESLARKQRLLERARSLNRDFTVSFLA